MHLTQGACEFLDYLKANNIPYAIATGSPMINIEFYFKYLDLEKWFAMDNIISLDSISKSKLNSDYNFTDTTKKQYRYQAVYDLVY